MLNPDKLSNRTKIFSCNEKRQCLPYIDLHWKSQWRSSQTNLGDTEREEIRKKVIGKIGREISMNQKKAGVAGQLTKWSLRQRFLKQGIL